MRYKCHDNIERVFGRNEKVDLCIINAFSLIETLGHKSGIIFSTWPLASLFVLKIHLQPISLHLHDNSTKPQTPIMVHRWHLIMHRMYQRWGFWTTDSLLKGNRIRWRVSIKIMFLQINHVIIRNCKFPDPIWSLNCISVTSSSTVIGSILWWNSGLREETSICSNPIAEAGKVE